VDERSEPLARGIGQRIAIIGSAGAGKSYLARELAKRLRFRYIDRDGLVVVGSNWERRPRAESLPIFDEATREPGWTYDGNLRASREYEQLVLSRCDTIIWLDFSTWRLLASVIPRTLRRAITRERLWGRNVEGWRQVFWLEGSIAFVWRYYPRMRREYEALFAAPEYESKIRLRLHSRAEVNRWLANVSEGPRPVASD
jgi:adenylate kinase family enzyme